MHLIDELFTLVMRVDIEGNYLLLDGNRSGLGKFDAINGL